MTTSKLPESTSTRNRTLLLIAAIILIIGVIAFRYCAGLNVNYVNPMVTVERAPIDERAMAKVMPLEPANTRDIPEVYRTAERLREASALALGAALYAANEIAIGHRISDTQTLLAGMLSAGLLPPGIELRPPAMLLSTLGNFLLRFRPDPLTVEVIETPLRREDGPALMVCIPGSGPNAEAGSVFIADRLGEIAVPAPFASLSECVRAGWIDQSLTQVEITPSEQQQLRTWLSWKLAANSHH